MDTKRYAVFPSDADLPEEISGSQDDDSGHSTPRAPREGSSNALGGSGSLDDFVGAGLTVGGEHITGAAGCMPPSPPPTPAAGRNDTDATHVTESPPGQEGP